MALIQPSCFLITVSYILILCHGTLELADIGLTRQAAERNICPPLIIDAASSSLMAEAVRLCQQQTYNQQQPKCFIGNCQSILPNGKVTSENTMACQSSTERAAWIFDSQCKSNNAAQCAYSAGASTWNAALLPSDEDIEPDQLVCIEYKYYMAICVLLMIAFASFLCFIVVALNKLKQLREMSDLYW